ncbi:phosphatase PAP2 family protein [Effusibacillus pohliae]|uniref:phosphatase PAP2 family protein n=1 Tax=Effusibacillus pohliae TaxID=232270 RepID=UPI000475E240|nr:phosphatase PAP2 family protein [Effusibacillus pohliae]
MQRVAEWIRGGDVTTFFWMNHSLRFPLLDRVMPLITHLGGAVWCIGFTLILLVGGGVRWQQTGIHLALSLLISHLIVAVCKKILPRPRPYQVLEDVCTGRKLLRDASFPSGHATAAFCMATVLSVALPACILVFYSLAAAVAVSRVYLGLHYPSDVTIGAALGIGTAWMLV